MNELKPGVKVVFVDDDHTLKKGVILSSYEILETAIVGLDDGSGKKISYDRLAIDTDAKGRDVENEPEEIETIKISRKQFKDILLDSIADLTDGDTNIGFPIIVFGVKLMCDLFDND